MIFDGVPFSILQNKRSKGLTAFVELMERKLGARMLYDARDIPLGRPDLIEQCELAQVLMSSGVIKSFATSSQFEDDPKIRLWSVTSASEHESHAGGIATENDADALTGALAEALERYLWRETNDYSKRMNASIETMKKSRTVFTNLERFAGYSKAQRKERPELAITPETPLSWIQGFSLVSGKTTFVPTQTVSGRRVTPREPSIRSSNTTGLATWPTQAGARLRGAFESIERDAYMIMWLNQLTLPRLRLDLFLEKDTSLSRLIQKCRQYRMNVHVVELLTDAPAHAIMVVLEDESGQAPRFSIGLKVGSSLSHVVEKALLESLRGHRASRRQMMKGEWDLSTPTKDVGHYDRTHYWAMPQNARHLEFLIAGKEKDPEQKPWDKDNEEAHLARVTTWCRENEYECVSVALTGSRKNPTKLHIEMVVMPELQWMHLYEKDFALGGTRWQSVPKKFGYKPRAEMFQERPHPFA